MYNVIVTFLISGHSRRTVTLNRRRPQEVEAARTIILELKREEEVKVKGRTRENLERLKDTPQTRPSSESPPEPCPTRSTCRSRFGALEFRVLEFSIQDYLVGG